MRPLLGKTLRMILPVAAMAALGLSARAAEPVKNFAVVLLQPETVYEQRIASLDSLTAYIKAAEAAADAALKAGAKGKPNSGFIVIAVRPGRQSKVWFDFDAPLADPVRAALLQRIGAVKPFAATVGPVVFALRVGMWGGAAPARQLPVVPEWSEAARKAGRPLDTGEIVEHAWSE